MKISHTLTTAALLFGQTSSTFVVNRPNQLKNRPPNKSIDFAHRKLFDNTIHHQFRDLKVLWAQQGYEADDFENHLGDDKSPEAGYAFLDIVSDDMKSLQKKLENGLNPDIKFFLGNTILHLIALKGTSQSLDDDRYRKILGQMAKSGANLHATNDAGSSVLEFLQMTNSTVFAENLKYAQGVKIKPSIKRLSLDTQLATFSLQKKPTAIGKKLIPELIKMGANPNFVTFNGKTISENIKQNWPEASAQAFTKMFIAARFKRAANGQEKIPDNGVLADQWIKACSEFNEEFT